MLNIEEAGKLLKVSKRSLRNWEKQGKIKSYRTPGGHRRYDEKELLKIIGKNVD
jgi:excisionase family DNA binding protein